MPLAQMITAHSLAAEVVDGHRVLVLSSDDADVHAAVAPELGMLGCTLRHEGEELLGVRRGLAGYTRSGATMGVPLLHPWANRLGGYRYSSGGREVRLQGGTPVDPKGLPIHGLLAAVRDWVPAGSGAGEDGAWASAELDAGARPDVLAGFPFPHVIRVEARLSGATLSIETTLRATGDVPVPVCFGYHPYLRLPGVARADWHVRLPVSRQLRLDALKLPTGETHAIERYAGPLGDRVMDDAFAAPADGEPFVLSGGGRHISVAFDEGYPYAQVFAPAEEDVVCFEPMTAPGNALRGPHFPPASVEPGQEYRARFSISVQRA